MKRRHVQHGLSIVELMVGLAIGLVIVAAALFAMTHHLKESRQLLAETRLMQDLRTSSELIARALRRAGPFAQNDGGLHMSYPNSTEEFAYRLRNDTIEMQFTGGSWQAMTDVQTMRVSSLVITPHTHETVLDGFCSQACTEGSGNTCPPMQTVRRVDIRLEARAAADASVVRRLQSTVQLRHDLNGGACPA